jgi:hypothetical protein
MKRINWKQVAVWSGALTLPGGLVALGLYHLLHSIPAKQVRKEIQGDDGTLKAVLSCPRCVELINVRSSVIFHEHLIREHGYGTSHADELLFYIYTKIAEHKELVHS